MQGGATRASNLTSPALSNPPRVEFPTGAGDRGRQISRSVRRATLALKQAGVKKRFLTIIEETARGYSAYSPDLPACVSTVLASGNATAMSSMCGTLSVLNWCLRILGLKEEDIHG